MKYLTTSQGVPVVDNQNSLTVGRRGPTLLQDVQLIEKLAHFNRERIPERVVHAKGAGAHGHFRVYGSMAPHTHARFLQDANKQTPVFVRFSTVVGSRGSADSVRDPRGFAVKFYTADGNYDLVGNNLPVFFIRDAIKFPDLVHALKPSPDSNLPDPNRFWDFISLTPESLHMITWLFSDRGTVRSYRAMEGFGVNTYVWINHAGRQQFVKYHWKPAAGVQTIDRYQSTLLAGTDPDVAGRDLHETIATGGTVSYELQVQLMDVADELNQDFDPLDATKTWPEGRFPLIPVGVMVLDRNPADFFAEVEQAAFCPASLVPGIELSADKLLQGRAFAYADTQRYRLGTNFLQLPVNAPKVPVNNYQRDGAMQYAPYDKGPVNYEPNSLAGGQPQEAPPFPAPSFSCNAQVVRQRLAPTDDYHQAGERYRSLNRMEQEHLVDNIVSDLGQTVVAIQQRMVEHLLKADPELGRRVAAGLGKPGTTV